MVSVLAIEKEEMARLLHAESAFSDYFIAHMPARNWTHQVQDARAFEFRTDAELIGSVECPLPLADWEVVEVGFPPGRG